MGLSLFPGGTPGGTTPRPSVPVVASRRAQFVSAAADGEGGSQRLDQRLEVIDLTTQDFNQDCPIKVDADASSQQQVSLQISDQGLITQIRRGLSHWLTWQRDAKLGAVTPALTPQQIERHKRAPWRRWLYKWSNLSQSGAIRNELTTTQTSDEGSTAPSHWAAPILEVLGSLTCCLPPDQPRNHETPVSPLSFALPILMPGTIIIIHHGRASEFTLYFKVACRRTEPAQGSRGHLTLQITELLFCKKETESAHDIVICKILLKDLIEVHRSQYRHSAESANGTSGSVRVPLGLSWSVGHSARRIIVSRSYDRLRRQAGMLSTLLTGNLA